MSAKQLMLPAHRAFNSDGAPEAGAHAYLYLSGTNTPALFYEDAGLTVSLGSRIEANSAGRFEPMPYQDETIPFRLIIQDNEGVVLDDIDPFYFGFQVGVAGPQGPAGDVAKVADRTALAAVTAPSTGYVRHLNETGRAGIFVFDSSNLATQVAADVAQGIYVPPSTDTTGASGAWVRKFDGPLWVNWFGLVEGDNSANAAGNTTNFTRLLATLSVTGHLHVKFPYGVYWLGDAGAGAAIELLHGSLILEGSAGGGLSPTPVTQLKFPAGVTGIRVHDSLTSGFNTKDSVAHGNGDGTLIRNLTLKGAYTTTEAEAHGIQLRRRSTIEDVTVQGFEGDGFYLAASSASASGAATPYGNNNCTMLLRVSAKSCRRGIYMNGGDCNAVTVIMPNMNSNRQCGIWNSSSINNFNGGQLATNGIVADNDGVTVAASACSYGGNRYGVILGQEVDASTNAPSGTTAHNTYWYYIGAGGPTSGYPAWVSGMSWRPGGPIICDSLAGANTYTGIYMEESELKSQIKQTNIVLGGNVWSHCYKNPAINYEPPTLGADSSGWQIRPALTVDSGDVNIVFGNISNNPNRILYADHATYAPNGWRLSFQTSSNIGDLWLNYAGTNMGYMLTGPTTANQFGTGAAFSYGFYAPYLTVGDDAGSVTNARRLTIDTAAPGSGAHAIGEYSLRRTSTTTDPFAARCVTAGTPGTWQSLYALSSLTATASGLTVSATDKLLGRSTAGAGAVEEIACTAAGRALLDDADTTAQAKTLGTDKVIAQTAVAVPLTGSTSETTLATITVPASAMGANGRVEIYIDTGFTGTAGNKTINVYFGGTLTMTHAAGAAETIGRPSDIRITNRNNASSQRWDARWINASSSQGKASQGTTAINTGSSVDIVIKGQLGNAADTLTLEAYQVVVYPKD